MRTIFLLLISLSLNADVYRVYLKNGSVDFVNFSDANKYANLNFADSVKLITPAKSQILINDSISIANKESVTKSLKSKAYSALQNVTIGATLTSQQLQRIAWISLWNTGAINPATNRIDSTLNYIH